MLNDNFLPLYRGVVLLVEKGSLHRCVVEVSSYERYIIHVSYETLWLLSSPQTNLISILEYAGNYTIFDDEQLEEISSLIEECLHQSSEIGADFERNILFMRIILYIIQHLNRRHLSTAVAPSKEFLKVMPIINYIHDNYDHEISLDAISRDFFISKYYLCRLLNRPPALVWVGISQIIAFVSLAHCSEKVLLYRRQESKWVLEIMQISSAHLKRS